MKKQSSKFGGRIDEPSVEAPRRNEEENIVPASDGTTKRLRINKKTSTPSGRLTLRAKYKEEWTIPAIKAGTQLSPTRTVKTSSPKVRDGIPDFSAYPSPVKLQPKKTQTSGGHIKTVAQQALLSPRNTLSPPKTKTVHSYRPTAAALSNRPNGSTVRAKDNEIVETVSEVEAAVRSSLTPSVGASPGRKHKRQDSVKSVKWDPAIVSIGPVSSPTAPGDDDKGSKHDDSKTKLDDRLIDFTHTIKNLKRGNPQVIAQILEALKGVDSDDDVDSDVIDGFLKSENVAPSQSYLADTDATPGHVDAQFLASKNANTREQGTFHDELIARLEELNISKRQYTDTTKKAADSELTFANEEKRSKAIDSGTSFEPVKKLNPRAPVFTGFTEKSQRETRSDPVTEQHKFVATARKADHSHVEGRDFRQEVRIEDKLPKYVPPQLRGDHKPMLDARKTQEPVWMKVTPDNPVTKISEHVAITAEGLESDGQQAENGKYAAGFAREKCSQASEDLGGRDLAEAELEYFTNYADGYAEDERIKKSAYEAAKPRLESLEYLRPEVEYYTDYADGYAENERMKRVVYEAAKREHSKAAVDEHYINLADEYAENERFKRWQYEAANPDHGSGMQSSADHMAVMGPYANAMNDIALSTHVHADYAPYNTDQFAKHPTDYGFVNPGPMQYPSLHGYTMHQLYGPLIPISPPSFLFRRPWQDPAVVQHPATFPHPTATEMAPKRPLTKEEHAARVARSLDPVWGGRVLNQFSEKFPMTGKAQSNFPVPPIQKLDTEAAQIQQKLELLILQGKEKKVFEERVNRQQELSHARTPSLATSFGENLIRL